MRKQIAAANWKMNLTYQQAEKLLHEILNARLPLAPHQQVLFGVPFPYLIMANSEVADDTNYSIAAQNCSDKKRAPIRVKFRRRCCNPLVSATVLLDTANAADILVKRLKR